MDYRMQRFIDLLIDGFKALKIKRALNLMIRKMWKLEIHN